MNLNLTPKEMQTIAGACRVAAVVYDADADTADKANAPTVANQFRRQADAARTVADQFDGI